METVTLRPDYGMRKSAPIDLNSDRKLRDPSIGLRPFDRSMENSDSKSGLKTLQQVLAYHIGKTCGLRGDIEPAGLRKNSFELGVQHGGPNHNRKYVKLIGLDGRDKAAKLSLANPHQATMGNTMIIWESPSLNDQLDYVRMMEFYYETQLNPLRLAEGIADCPFFLRRAPGKVLKVSVSYVLSLIHI